MWRHTIIIIQHKAVVVLLRNSFCMLAYTYYMFVYTAPNIFQNVSYYFENIFVSVLGRVCGPQVLSDPTDPTQARKSICTDQTQA